MADLATETEPEAFDVFLEYRLTSMLLSLVVAIIGQDASQQNLLDYEPPLESSLSSRRRALNALANVLVRNVEAVAITTSGPSPPPSCSTSSDTPNTLDILVVQEKNDTTSEPPFTMVPNSRLSDPPTSVQGPWLTTIPPGQSKWADIMDSPWTCVAKPNEILSLSDHLATMEQYLNEYQLRTQPTVPKSIDQSAGNAIEDQGSENSKTKSVRGRQFDSFVTYLISTCYPRVRRQLSNTLSKKLFSLLSSITGPQLECHLKMETLKMSDLHLCKVIYIAQSGEDSYDFQAMVQELKGSHCCQNQLPAEEPDTRSPQKASPLFDAVTNTVKLIKSGTRDSSQLPILYTKETRVDFHYLLLFSLNKYRDAITLFYNHVMDGSLIDKDRRDLRVYSFLLWRLAQSPILHIHLEFLCNLIPQNFMCSDIEQHAHESPAVDHIGGGGDEGMLGDEDASGDDGGVQEEMAAIEGDWRHRRDPALMIQRWICLLVSHLQALHLLSSFTSLSPPTVVRIQQIAVKTIKFETPQDWTVVLKNILATRECPLSAQYNRLEEIILCKINAANAAGSGPKGIFRYFKGNDALSGGGRVHCGAGLAATLHLSPQDTAAMEQYKFDGKNALILSKLCCPLCWELFGHLRTDTFGVRGRTQSVLTPMELPGWICQETAERLLKLLRNRLYEELKSLLKKTSEDSRRNKLSELENDSVEACDDITLDLASLFNLDVSCHIPHRTTF